MSKHIVESIVSGNMLDASDMLEAKLEEIRDRKLYEMKRMYAAEAFGGYSLAQIKADLASGKKVRASAPKEKGGLGLSPYDQLKMKQKQKEREKERGQEHKKPSSKKSGAPDIDMSGERRINEDDMTDSMGGKTKTDNFKDYTPERLKSLRLKKDPRGRTLDRLRQNLQRYDTLKARGSKTADARMLKIAKGYSGDVAKQAVKNVVKAPLKVFKGADFISQMSDIGSSNLR